MQLEQENEEIGKQKQLKIDTWKSYDQYNKELGQIQK